jgi:hypothetical protein
MDRQLADAVIPGFPSSIPAEAFPAGTPRSARETLQLVEGLRPTSGNLTPDEAWRRIVGGRSRYNHERQQTARARRGAILIWLLENRMYFRNRRLGYLGTDHIVMQHGDGAMLSKALRLGKATLCRDLSSLQATHPELFGNHSIGMSYDEYMGFWRHARQAGLGNEQPGQNLRFPRNQHGPEARTRRSVVRVLGHDVYQPPPATESATQAEDRNSDKTSRTVPTTDDFLATLDSNCPQQIAQVPNARRRHTLRSAVSL